MRSVGLCLAEKVISNVTPKDMHQMTSTCLYFIFLVVVGFYILWPDVNFLLANYLAHGRGASLRHGNNRISIHIFGDSTLLFFFLYHFLLYIFHSLIDDVFNFFSTPTQH